MTKPGILIRDSHLLYKLSAGNNSNKTGLAPAIYEPPDIAEVHRQRAIELTTEWNPHQIRTHTPDSVRTPESQMGARTASTQESPTAQALVASNAAHRRSNSWTANR